MLIDSFVKLSEQKGIQVILTTHSPMIVKKLRFENLRVIQNDENEKGIISIEEARLPIPSLNEVNFLAFGEAGEEYHDELYGYLENEKYLDEYEKSKDTRAYIKEIKNGGVQITLTRYIRHQIHHPENKMNIRYTDEELQKSINAMRDFIKSKRANDA